MAIFCYAFLIAGLQSGEDVASWLKQGVVGQPKYNPVTKEIIGNPKGHSDVTLQVDSVHV